MMSNGEVSVDSKNSLNQNHRAESPLNNADEGVNSSVSPVNLQPQHPAVNATANGPNATATKGGGLQQWQQWSSPESMAVAFAENKKAQMSARAMFELVHQYGDNLREGWKNVLDCLLYLLKANLLPVQMVKIEDFVEPSGQISLKDRFKRRPVAPKKEESGLLSWLGLTGGSGSGGGESGQSRRPTEEERELCKLASNVVLECHPEQLVTDSRYLASSALTELMNSIIHCSFIIAPVPHPPMDINSTHQHFHHPQPHTQQESQDDDSLVDLSAAAVPLLPVSEHLQQVPENSEQHHQQSPLDSDHHHCHGHEDVHHKHSNILPSVCKLTMEEEEAMVFLLELMISIVLENRDRLAQVWQLVREHLRWLLSHFPHNQQLMERAVVAIIRIANRNLFRLGQHSPQPGMVTVAQQTHQQTTSIIVQRTQNSGDPAVQNKSVVIVMDQVDEAPRVPLPIPENQTIQDRTNHCADEVLQFMRSQLLSLRPPELFLFSRQIAFGLYTLLRANAANVHASEHWEMFFVLLEAVGAAAYQDQDDVEVGDELNHRLSHNNPHKIHGKRSVGNSQHHHYHKNKLGSIQSEPENLSLLQQQQKATTAKVTDDRGYCSDDPLLAGTEGGAGRRTENPLLSTDGMTPLRLVNKADSGEWIHVVPITQDQTVTATQSSPPTSLPQPSLPIPATLPQHSNPAPEVPAAQSATTQSTVHPSPEISQSQCAMVAATQPSSNTPPSSLIPTPPLTHQSDPIPDPSTIQSLHPLPPPPPHPRAGIFKRGTVVLAPNLSRHDPAAFLKVCEILAFLSRDAAHITPANFTQFTRCLRIMVEASLDGGKCAPIQLPASSFAHQSTTVKQFPMPSEQSEKEQQISQNNTTEFTEGEKISEQERLANCYMDASLQLLNICAQLHARAATIYNEWTSASEDGALHSHQQHSREGSGSTTELWTAYWRPLLQAMARMSCDCRRRIRAQALDTLGSSFRVPALGKLMQPADWEDCFAEVLFPLLNRLLSSSPPISPMDPIGMEEARIRAIQFTCKILLGHLTQISRLNTFADLLRRLFDLTDQFLGGSACSDLLAEVIQESLKNCILVFENFGVFRDERAGLHGELQDRLEALAKKHGLASPIRKAT